MTATVDRQPVEDAEVDLREARAFVEQLEERVRDGDETVHPQDLAAARSHVDDLERYAQLRAQAAERRHDRAVEAERTERARQWLRDIDQLGVDDQEFLGTFDAAVTALRDLHAAAQRRSQVIEELRGDLSQIERHDELGFRVGAEHEGVALVARSADGSRRVQDVQAKHVVIAAAEAVLGQVGNQAPYVAPVQLLAEIRRRT